MSPQPREGLAKDGSCSPSARPHSIDGLGRLDPGHQMLRHFSHRCRNSLSGIKLGLYLLKKELDGPAPSRWDELGRTYEEIEKLFDGLQRIYQSRSLTLVRAPLGQLIGERLPGWRSRYRTGGRTILLDPPRQDLPGDFDPMHLGLGLDALVAWRAECGDSQQPRLAWRATGARFEICWEESDPVEPDRPGCSHDAGRGSRPADSTESLALLLLARVAADHGGELETRRDPALGIKLHWPQFREESPSR